ncbi:MAG: SDR family oxidoreductase [Eubacteriales bacterium]|nr:SDR family oxidoreductase [Eubacteriales bacterium]
MVPDFSVKGKVFVVTGGSGVLCSEMCRELNALGAKVAVLNRSAEKGQALADELNASGGDALAVSCDVTDEDAVRRARAVILEKYGRVDVLINGAGGNQPAATASDERSFFDLTPEALRGVMDLNFMGTLLPSQIFGETMAAQKKGSIINLASMAGIRPLTRVAGYGAAKAAVVNLTQWMATWFARNASAEIRVNAIAPGFFLTEQNRFLMTDRETGEPTPRGRHVLMQTPMERYGKPEELVGAVVYLASDASTFVTGACIPIDGGFAAFGI